MGSPRRGSVQDLVREPDNGPGHERGPRPRTQPKGADARYERAHAEREVEDAVGSPIGFAVVQIASL